ncbi:glycoside hydrolase family 13 protein [Streptomyces iconiensis]|uniref:Glycoside hydrolase family 13 protein n=1 Tax=Streptomyces iconiensis TaxID=1384038 RepID=A0ABT6ZSW8_9ACTN|nr:glycoside hydrolase family 13 protein [Streptomyces iconiensis]MDJ1132151.1 glycoside hydrolase family 13 protein [Streptomyces iconiensis]
MSPTDWWRSAAIYQVYVRSFADGNGDGTGDLAGVRARLPYLAELGVDALWFTPWYLSPLADGGYDVADYRTIDPAFGTLAEAEKLLAEARELGLRTIVDIVPNHVSDQHPWFRAALAAGPGSPEQELFHFSPPSPEPPNDWVSEFGGVPWSRTGSGQWYLHLFTPEQPDLNWSHPKVRQEHEDVLRFWLDRGAAGVRIDSAALLAKAEGLPDMPRDAEAGPHPFHDRPELHGVYRSWRRIAEEYGAVLIGEIWLPDAERFARYLRPDELHTAFNFDFLARPWDAVELRASIDLTLAAHAPVGAPATWVLANHDVTRTVTRYGRAEDTGFAFERKRFGVRSDLALGTRRARAAALLSLALPGSVYLYQGEELGLPEAEIPRELIQDPMHARSGGVDPGRDGCRVPLPWSADGDGPSWLPRPDGWERYAAERQATDPDSMLALYRTALRLRSSFRDAGPLRWLRTDDPHVLSFARSMPHGDGAGLPGAGAGDDGSRGDGGTLLCVVNLGAPDVMLPAHSELLLASGPLTPVGTLPQDTAVWLRA